VEKGDNVQERSTGILVLTGESRKIRTRVTGSANGHTGRASLQEWGEGEMKLVEDAGKGGIERRGHPVLYLAPWKGAGGQVGYHIIFPRKNFFLDGATGVNSSGKKVRGPPPKDGVLALQTKGSLVRSLG